VLDDSLKQEDLVPQSDAWWNLEKQKKIDELAVVKKSAQVSQQSHSRVEQFISTLLWSLDNVDPDAIGQVVPEDKKPPLPERGEDGSNVTTENIDKIGSSVKQLCEWLLSDRVEDLIHRARQDSTVRFNYRLHPLNRRVKKDPPPRRKKKNEHYRREQEPHPLENLLFNPLRMPLTETDIDSVETKNMREEVMGRRDVKNMSLARFRICTPLQVKKELAETDD